MNTSHAELILEVDAFMARTGISATRLGYACFGDPGFVASLRRGRDPRLSTVERLLAYLRQPGVKQKRGKP